MVRVQRALPEGTARLAGERPGPAWRQLHGGLVVSGLGFGAEALAQDGSARGEVLARALRAGINVVHAGAGCAESQRLAGRVLARGLDEGWLRRDRVVVVADSGGAPDDPRAALDPEAVLAAARASREAWGLQCLDLFLWRAIPSPAAAGLEPERWARRAGEVLAALERLRAKGQIAAYGVAGAGLCQAPEDPGLVPLQLLCGRAGSGLRALGLPLNLVETGAACQLSQPGGLSPLAWARERGLAVLCCRPLAARSTGGPLRLVETPPRPAPERAAVERLLEDLAVSEATLRQRLLPELGLGTGELAVIEPGLSLSASGGGWLRAGGLEGWRGIEAGAVGRLNAAGMALAGRLAGSREGLAALDAHLGRARAALTAVWDWFAAAQAPRLARLAAAARAADPEWAAAPGLAGLALAAPLSTAGVGCVLTGMHRPAYLQAALALMATAPQPAPRDNAWRRLAGAGAAWLG